MADADLQICVTPLSSPYSVLPRAHTYALAAALIFPLGRGWLFRAALAAFTTRTAVTVIDVILLVHDVSYSWELKAAPVDIFVMLDFLALAVAVACWLLLASSSAAISAARSLIRLWTALVVAGSILTFVTVAKLGRLAARGGIASVDSSNQCSHGIPMDSTDVFGSKEDVPVLGVIGSSVAWLERRVGIPPLVLSALAVVAMFLPRSVSLGAPRVYVEENSEEISSERAVPWSRAWLTRAVAGIALTILLPGTAILIAVSSEQYIYILARSLPSAEPIHSVGQWGVWAATGIVVLATLVNASLSGESDGEDEEDDLMPSSLTDQPTALDQHGEIKH